LNAQQSATAVFQMHINEVRKNWNNFGKTDPLWAIITWDDKKGGRWQRDEFFRTGEEEITRIMEYLRSLGINLARRRALDFGCGVGRLSQALANHFSEVCGVDIAPSMIRLAKEYNRHRNCRYFLNGRAHLRLFGDANFDFIYSSLTLQHLEPRYIKAYLREFLRLLVPDGILVFNLPSERLCPGMQTEGTEGMNCRTQDTRAEEQREHRSAARIKRLIKPLTPKPILDLYVKLRYVRPPEMEMHTMKRDEVEGFLELHGGRIVDALQFKMGNTFTSYRYCVTQSASKALDPS
jgi:SAM-dependent methyltransferase